MKVEINDPNIKDVVSKAILETMSAEQRDRLMEQALSYLMSEQEKGSGWSAKKFIPLHDAFNEASAQEASKAARTMLSENPEFQQKLQQLVTDAMADVFVKNREKVINAMSDAFMRGFEREY